MSSLAEPGARYAKVARAERPLAAFVPFSSLLSEHVAITRSGYYLRTWRLAGVPFECADEHDIAQRHESKCHLLAALGGGSFAIWEHRVQRRIADRLTPPKEGFAREFDDAYAARINAKPFLSNELYFTLVYRPQAGTARLFQQTSRTAEAIARDQDEALALMAEKAVMVERMLRDSEPQALGAYQRQGTWFSELAEFYGFLVNGSWKPMRLEAAPLYRTLPTTRLTFGGGALELRTGLDTTRYGVLVDIKEYAEGVEPGSLNDLLYEDIEYIETQAFAIINRREALDALKRQQKQLMAAEDVVASQVAAMDDALDGLGNGSFVMGQYHYALMVLGNDLHEAQRRSARAVAAIAEGSGINMVPVDLVADAAWFSQMPGNFRWRTRQAQITSRAYAALASNHNFSRGKREGNPWGTAAMLVRTPSGQPFYLNLHASPAKEDAEDRKLPGNTMIIGVTGAGKTTLELAILASLCRYDPAPRLVIFDKDRGCEIFVRAMGGRYFTLHAGRPTGVNPFQRVVNPQRLKFWEALVKQCLHSPSLPLLPSDERAVHEAVRAVASMPREFRRMSTVKQNLPRDGANSLYERLARWCEGGALGWVFDEADDRLVELADAAVIGFDYTEFLDDKEVRTALMMALLNVMDELIDGRRLVYVMTEFWKAIGDDSFAGFAKDKQKTIRKQNGLGIFDTQS
ncbi:MAG: VirB4 family type IV secretion/conjugal transfer ATPase, partial [Vitreoscilla sp.]|nr:VirB4 family type IV secretion/conjugal transfer ATPase [Vitreoscilla sp.]